jgi:phenylpropionate dioxygenase-like ring-hydroxylating dioxygenase large terminal subunit
MAVRSVDNTASSVDGVTPPSQNDWVPGQTPMRDAWIPMAHSVHITHKVTWRVLHSRRYFLWREAGQLRAAGYHPAQSAPSEILSSLYSDDRGGVPVYERYGLVWVWYGDPANARPSLSPNLAQLSEAGDFPAYMRGQTWMHSCSELAMENLMDLTHADFVHRDLLGDSLADDDVVTVESTSETITMTRTALNKTAAPVQQKAAGIKADKQNIRFCVHIYIRSHVAAIYSRFEPGLDVRMVHCSTPETRDSNRVNFIQDTRHALRPYKYLFPLASYKIAAQDNSALRPQGPRYHKEIKRRDLHSRFDTAAIRYRSLVKAILERQSRGDYSYESDDIISGDKSELLGIGRPIT